MYSHDNEGDSEFLRQLAVLNSALGNVDAAVRKSVEANFASRRSQTQCAAAGSSEDEGGRIVPRDVRGLSPDVLLLSGLPARGLEGGAQGRVQDAAGGEEAVNQYFYV